MLKYFDRVQETTAGTGTGSITLSGAVAGFRSFSSVLLSHEFTYEIHAVDGAGVPTGEWEVGIGDMSDSTTLRRLYVLSSSNADALVSFSAGSKVVSCTAASAWCSSMRRVADAAHIDYFVDPTSGDNNNDGLSEATAFATIQNAIDVAVDTACGSGAGSFNVRISLLAGSYGENVVLKKCDNRAAKFIIAGYYDYVTIDPASGVAIDAENCGEGWEIGWVELGGDIGLRVGRDSAVRVIRDTRFLSTATAQILVRDGGMFLADDGYSISGGSGAHWQVDGNSTVRALGPITFLANATYSGAFALCQRGLGHIDASGVTFSLGAYTVTGVRYDINGNGVCYTNGGGATFLPGDTAGTTATGGQYL